MNIITTITTTIIIITTTITTTTTIRVDNKRGFRLCNTPQHAELNSVDVRECRRWPCLARAGRRGSYKVTFTPYTDSPIGRVSSDIYAWVELPYGGQTPIRVSVPGETNQPVCPHLSPPCPLPPATPATLNKALTIPLQARMAVGNRVVVEFRVTDGQGRVMVCFHAPVIVA
ncbi:uncharacterized protein LOC123502860 [Portunus trituberculatus]|uniref:uncharacterized protein LOC123502860 n=1 Tax=Portunus trituberculatus TaxID=210409 RepID=UPI001E1D0D6E|nr:uncharacterized protein LOC123502860 [Portunus trituberculatus]